MRIELLFPEVANLYGDIENIDYIKRSQKSVTVVEDNLTQEPHFMSEVPDLIYMGTMSESAQLLVIEKLSGYREKLIEMIDSGVHFLITGNAIEIFGDEIREGDKVVGKGLGIFHTTVKRDMMKRFNSLYLGQFKPEGGESMTVVGYKSQFTHSYLSENFDESKAGFLFESERGPGLNPDMKEEGIRKNNFMATYVIGPLLILNPPFTKWLLKDITGEDNKLSFEEAAMEAYEVRVKEYSDPNTGFYY